MVHESANTGTEEGSEVLLTGYRGVRRPCLIIQPDSLIAKGYLPDPYCDYSDNACYCYQCSISDAVELQLCCDIATCRSDVYWIRGLALRVLGFGFRVLRDDECLQSFLLGLDSASGCESC